jgi:hypothetical protein
MGLDIPRTPTKGSTPKVKDFNLLLAFTKGFSSLCPDAGRQ